MACHEVVLRQKGEPDSHLCYAAERTMAALYTVSRRLVRKGVMDFLEGAWDDAVEYEGGVVFGSLVICFKDNESDPLVSSDSLADRLSKEQQEALAKMEAAGWEVEDVYYDGGLTLHRDGKYVHLDKNHNG